MTARALWGHAVDALFPPRCLLCDEVLGLLPECPACKGELARLSRGHAPGIAAAPLVAGYIKRNDTHPPELLQRLIDRRSLL